MSGGNINLTSNKLFPIKILVNYWEIHSDYGRKLDDLLGKGISQVATFIPWQAVEADISHSLMRFLTAVAERKMSVTLILSPEVGVHFPNSGLPKDIFAKSDNIAKHSKGGSVAVGLPPKAFPLPSFFSPEFTKRYYNFLSRLDNLFVDFSKLEGDLLGGVTLALSGSFWKYYRPPQGGAAGDYQASVALTYRQRMEQFFAQKEFSDPSPAAANRWKSHSLDQVNRRWFYQQSEDVFRTRSSQQVRRKSSQLRLEQLEIYTPEADPSYTYSNFLQNLTSGYPDFGKLSSLLDEAACRASCGSDTPAEPYIHWTSLGGFGSLSDSEKQFLILKSILVMGGRGGGVMLDEAEWFGMSQSFRARAENLARSLSQGDLRLRNQALYLVPHLWSEGGTVWQELRERVGARARMISSLDLVLRERDARLLIVDPTFIFTREAVAKLLNWAQGGRVLVLPRSPLFTEGAKEELEKLLARNEKIEIDLGVSYELYIAGEGRIILHELPEGLLPHVNSGGEILGAWQTFLTSVLGVADVQPLCSLSDSRLTVVPLNRKEGGLGLFILNGTRRPVAADVIFPMDVVVSDLTNALVAEHQMTKGKGTNVVIPANRFSLEVPPCGVLPLSVHRAVQREAPKSVEGVVWN